MGMSLSQRRGFSLVELMVTVFIMLAVAAIAIPQISTAISDYRLKTSMSQMSGMLQSARINAVKSNVTVGMVSPSTTDNGRSYAYADVNGNGSYDTGEPLVEFPLNISVQYGGYPGDATTNLGYTPQTVAASKLPKFNARGLPCVVPPSGTLCQNNDGTNQVGYVLYLRNQKTFGVSGWGAVTITPSGRIRTWFYNGSSYSPM